MVTDEPGRSAGEVGVARSDAYVLPRAVLACSGGDFASIPNTTGGGDKFANDPDVTLASSKTAPVVAAGKSVSLRMSRSAARLVANNPCALFCCICSFMWGLVLAVVISGVAQFSGQGYKDWDVLGSPYVQAKDAIGLAEKSVDCAQAPYKCVDNTWERSRADFAVLGLIFAYQSTSGPIFTPKNLQTMCKVERVFLGSPVYPDFCPLFPGRATTVRHNNSRFRVSDCRAQLSSVMVRAYESAGMDPLECGLLPEVTVRNLTGKLYSALDNPALFHTWGSIVGSDVYRDGRWTGEQTTRTRSALAVGFPFFGIDRESSLDPDVAAHVVNNFYPSVEDAFLRLFNKEHRLFRSAYWDSFVLDGVEVFLESRTFWDGEVKRVLDPDMSCAALSIVFVLMYFMFHMGSVFVALVSLWQIVMTIPMCLFPYRFIFGITYFNQLHGLLIFLILGVGADDVFVFADAWEQSLAVVRVADAARPETERRKDPWDERRIVFERMVFCYRHASIAIMNTSFTTAVAFLSTVSTPIMPIRALSVFACLLILANYLCVLTVTPLVYAIRERYLPIWKCPCGRRCSRNICSSSRSEITSGSKDIEGATPVEEACAPLPAAPQPPPHPAVPDTVRTSGAMRPTPGDAQAEPVLSLQQETGPWFIRRVYIPMMKKRCVAPLCAFVLTAWAVGNIVCAANLGAPGQPYAWFGKGHLSTRARAFNSDQYAASASSSYNTLTISFGIAGIDRERPPGVDQWKPHEWFGEPVYDPRFNLSTSASQEFLRQFCRDLRAQSCSVEGCQPSGTLVQPGVTSVSCFIEDLDASNFGRRYEGEEFMTRLRNFRRIRRPSSQTDREDWSKGIGFYGETLRYVEVQAVMSLPERRSVDVKRAVLSELEAFLSRQRSLAPPEMQSILQSVPFDWFWLATTDNLTNGFFVGLGICFPVAFGVLLLATGNVVIAGLAIVNFMFIVGCVLGYCKFVDWTLGPSECVAGTIVLGLAVDYVIHLGHVYVEASHVGLRTRRDRWEFALNAMGTTVIAGAATTFFSASVMQLCEIEFFNQMSTLIMLTIAYSLVYSLFCFMSFLYIAGPEGSFGDVSCVRLRAWLKRYTVFQ